MAGSGKDDRITGRSPAVAAAGPKAGALLRRAVRSRWLHGALLAAAAALFVQPVQNSVDEADVFIQAEAIAEQGTLVLRNQGAELAPDRFDRGVAIGLAILEHLPDQHDELAGEGGDGDVVALLAPHAIEGGGNGGGAAREHLSRLDRHLLLVGSDTEGEKRPAPTEAGAGRCIECCLVE